MVFFSLNFKFFNFNDSCPFTVTSDPLLIPTLVEWWLTWHGISVTRAASAPGVAKRGRAQAVLVPAASLEGRQPLPARGELVREEEPPPAATAQAAQPRWHAAAGSAGHPLVPLRPQRGQPEHRQRAAVHAARQEDPKGTGVLSGLCSGEVTCLVKFLSLPLAITESSFCTLKEHVDQNPFLRSDNIQVLQE